MGSALPLKEPRGPHPAPQGAGRQPDCGERLLCDAQTTKLRKADQLPRSIQGQGPLA